MHRASRHSGRDRSLHAYNDAPVRPHRRREQHEMVAEVSGRSADGAYLARLRSKTFGARGRFAARRSERRNEVVVASTPEVATTNMRPRRAGLSTRDFLDAAGVSNSSRDAAAPDSAHGVYAQGMSHPEDDERLPRRQQAANPPMIGTAEAIVAPRSETGIPHRTAQPQIVSGFGGEVAIASGSRTDRPGGTRRRNHPVPASALPEDAAPVTLEDREAITDAAVRPAVLPVIYDRSGRLVMPAPLKGSREVLVHQNTMATSEGLERIQDDGELDRLRAEHQLVGFPASESLRINEDLPANRRYARPWTVLFAQEIARDFYARFRQPLQVNSAVRTVSYQLRLQRVNGNAAAIDGDGASPHLTGQAIDLGKRGMNAAQLAWMRDYLLPLMQAGKIDVEEEFQQACFHITVYKIYVPATPRHPRNTPLVTQLASRSQ